ncbi:unnamed protein product [Caenorhabditis angaria]|uniref:Snurportin-1 n=1 Tax=Caenorhabditis angaria TaxID=860376 RepID=A0A9P1I9U0_9PELO|nr:unnamed protein product [Caenorhabditis angaria]
MTDDLDLLTSQLQEGFQVDPNALGEHPRYSQFKNLSKAAEQQAKRRQEVLDRHRDGRFEKLIKLRNLALDEEDSSDDEKEEKYDNKHNDDGSSVISDYSQTSSMRSRSKYSDQLLLSEWLVDIPSSLSNEWTMVAAPTGKRCLVVAAKGVTTAYNKAGRVIQQFQSKLPGGNDRGKYTFSILDCIYHDKVYYVLDILSWNEREYADNPYDFRMFWLNSKFEESPELSKPTKNFKYTFQKAPSCKCSLEEMTKMMSEPMKFHLDGLLFYHNSVIYEAGQSPLVGWLKPWMLPEILNVPVCELYQEKGKKYESSREYIDKFNKRHGHISKIGDNLEVETME